MNEDRTKRYVYLAIGIIVFSYALYVVCSAGRMLTTMDSWIQTTTSVPSGK